MTRTRSISEINAEIKKAENEIIKKQEEIALIAASGRTYDPPIGGSTGMFNQGTRRQKSATELAQDKIIELQEKINTLTQEKELPLAPVQQAIPARPAVRPPVPAPTSLLAATSNVRLTGTGGTASSSSSSSSSTTTTKTTTNTTPTPGKS